MQRAPSPSDLQPELLTTSEAARKMRVSSRTLLRFARSGRIRTIRMGRRVLIPAEQIRLAMDEGIPLDA